MNNENKHVAITYVFLPLNVVKSEGRINTCGGQFLKKCVGPPTGSKWKAKWRCFAHASEVLWHTGAL